MNVNKRRIGMFKVSIALLEVIDYESLVNILKDFIIIRCECAYATQEMEYIAMSKYFEELEKGYIPPEYTFTIVKIGKEHIIKDVKKIN